MSHWLDVSFNLLIGTKTKYLWKATTILGLNPSSFYTSYQSGDSLKSTYQKVYTYTYYRKLDPSLNEQMNYYKTTKLALTNYVDLYTTLNGSAYRKSDSETKYFYTEHYSDTNYIIDLVNLKCSQGNTICGPDFFA